MRKLIAILAVALAMSFGAATVSYAKNETMLNLCKTAFKIYNNSSPSCFSIVGKYDTVKEWTCRLERASQGKDPMGGMCWTYKK